MRMLKAQHYKDGSSKTLRWKKDKDNYPILMCLDEGVFSEVF